MIFRGGIRIGSSYLNSINFAWPFVKVVFDVKDEWEENSALKKKTRVEKQENVSGRHFIEE